MIALVAALVAVLVLMVLALGGRRAPVRKLGGPLPRSSGDRFGPPERKWAVFSGVWTESRGNETRDTPKVRVTANTCKALCENNPDCAAWVNNPETYCHNYTYVPRAFIGSPGWAVGIKL